MVKTNGAGGFVFEALESTQLKAIALLQAGEAPPFYVAAKRQTAGRGSAHKGWESPPGNVYWTGVFPACLTRDKSPRDSRLHNLAPAAILREILVKATGEERFLLKWPNDILFEGKKVAGVLCARGEEKGAAYLAVGIGLNVETAPAVKADFPPTCLQEIGGVYPPVEAFYDLLFEAFFTRAGGDETYRAYWNQYAAFLKERVTVKADGETFDGIFEGIDDSGAMRVRGEFETKVFHSAVFRPAALARETER